MVKIFTMVKDEVDIVEEWVVYHGHIFGFKNLYIIDNFSTDGTYQLLNTLKIKYDKIKKKKIFFFISMISEVAINTIIKL